MSILSILRGYFLEWEAKKSTFNKWSKMDESYEKNCHCVRVILYAAPLKARKHVLG